MAYNRTQKHRNKTYQNEQPRHSGKKRPFRKKLGRYEFYVEGCPSAVKVPDPSTGTLERALKYLKRQLKDSETLMKYRVRREFIKPSAKKRKMKMDAVRKQQLHDRITKRFWKNFVLLVPTKNHRNIGPYLPDLRDNTRR